MPTYITNDVHLDVYYTMSMDITFPVCIHKFTRAKINLIILVCLYVFVLKSMLKSNVTQIYAALVLLE